MKFFAFLISIFPLLGSAVMAYEGTFGRLLTGEKLTFTGKKWLKQIALWGAVSDTTIIGGILLRGFLRLTFYNSRTNGKLIVKKENSIDTESGEIQQMAQTVQSQKQVDDMAVAQKIESLKMSNEMDLIERQKRLNELKEQAKTDLVAQRAYEQLTNKYAKQKESDGDTKNSASSPNPKVNPQGIPSRKSANQIRAEKSKVEEKPQYQTFYRKNQDQLKSTLEKTKRIEENAQETFAKQNLKEMGKVYEKQTKKIPGLITQTLKQSFGKKPSNK